MSGYSKPTNEPFWWALFGAGGALAALFLPILLLLFGLAVPLGWVAEPDYASLLPSPSSTIVASSLHAK